MLRFILIALVVSASIYPLRAQDQLFLDSLVNAAREATNSVDRYRALHRLAVAYVDHDNECALQIVNKAEKVALESGDTLCIAKCRTLKARIYFRLGKPQEMVSTVKSLLEYNTLPKHTYEYFSVLTLLGVGRLIMSQFDDALNYHFQSLEYARSLKDPELISTSLINIGISYYKLKDYAKALPYMLKSYHIRDSLNMLGFLWPLNISLCYTYLRNFDKAALFLAESSSMCGSNCPPERLLHIKYASGSMFAGQQKYDEAVGDFENSLALSEKAKDHRMFLDNIYMLAKICIARNDVNAALKYLGEAEALINSGIPFNLEKVKIYELLAGFYLQFNDFEKASYYQSEYIRLKDSVHSETMTTSLMRIESEFLRKEHQARIAAQTEVIRENQQRLKLQTMVNIISGLLSIAAIALLVILYRNYKLKRTISEMLEAKVWERTTELEVEVSTLIKGLSERELYAKRQSAAINEVVSSLKGLAHIAHEEMNSDERQTFADKLSLAVDRLAKLC